MVAFVVSFLILIVGTAACFLVARRRPMGTPLTWGEAIVAGTYVFALMLLAYGIVPHQWLDFADNELLWRPDRILLGVSSAGLVFGADARDMGGTGRILVSYEVLRDVIAAALYGLFLGANVWLWSVWQKRGKKKPALEPVTSRFGRPVIRKA
jgi:hypothetical protein